MNLVVIHLEYKTNKFGLRKLFASDKDAKKIMTKFSCKTVILNDFDSQLGKKEVLSAIKELDKCVIYFSGHCVGEKFYLNQEYFTSQELYDNISDQALVILDCCNSKGLNLPYRLHDTFHLQKLVNLKKNIVCLTASQSYQKTAMSAEGSVFTNLLVKIWPGDCGDWSTFLKKFNAAYRKTIIRQYNFQQKIVITSSRYHLSIFEWLK